MIILKLGVDYSCERESQGGGGRAESEGNEHMGLLASARY